MFRRKFPLRRKALKVRHKAQAQWILDVHALHGDQIAGYLRCTLSKPDVVIVHGELVGVVRQRVHTCGTQDTVTYQVHALMVNVTATLCAAVTVDGGSIGNLIY